jgi:hypothetical protein
MKLDTDDIRCVQAVNFLQFCKQQDAFATTITLTELRQLVENEENLSLSQELPVGLVEIPQLPEISFRRILAGEYTLEDARRVFDPYFHDFLQTNLDDTARAETLRRKIMPSDIDKFLAEKHPPTAEDVKKLLPAEFHHHVEHFLPKNAETLPPHRPGTTRLNWYLERRPHTTRTVRFPPRNSAASRNGSMRTWPRVGLEGPPHLQRHRSYSPPSPAAGSGSVRITADSTRSPSRTDTRCPSSEKPSTPSATPSSTPSWTS